MKIFALDGSSPHARVGSVILRRLQSPQVGAGGIPNLACRASPIPSAALLNAEAASGNASRERGEPSNLKTRPIGSFVAPVATHQGCPFGRMNTRAPLRLKCFWLPPKRNEVTAQSFPRKGTCQLFYTLCRCHFRCSRRDSSRHLAYAVIPVGVLRESAMCS